MINTMVQHSPGDNGMVSATQREIPYPFPAVYAQTCQPTFASVVLRQYKSDINN